MGKYLHQITELSEVPANGDLILIQDVSDTTDSSSGTTKRITYSNLTSGLGGGGMSDVVDDTTPQLGGNLDVNGNSIVSTSGANITIAPNGTGNVILGTMTFNADQSIGAGQDNYVLTYDHSAGTIGLEAASGGGGGISDVVDDTTPQLGGDLDVNGNSIVSASNGNIVLEPNGTGKVGINKSSPDGALHVVSDSTSVPALTLETNEDSSSAGPIIDLCRISTTPADGDYLGQIKFKGESDTGAQRVYAKITGKTSDVSNTTEDGLLEIMVRNNGSNLITSRFTGSALKLINSTGLEVTGGDITTNVTASRAVVTDASSNLSASATTSTELGYVSGVTSAIQTQIDGKIGDVVDDTTPQLGGDLDVNGNSIVSASGGNITIDPNGSGQIHLKTGTGAGVLVESTTAGTPANYIQFKDTGGNTAYFGMNSGSTDDFTIRNEVSSALLQLSANGGNIKLTTSGNLEFDGNAIVTSHNSKDFGTASSAFRDGYFGRKIAVGGSALATATIYGHDAADEALIIRAASSQTADVVQIQNNGGTGLLTVGASGTTQLTNSSAAQLVVRGWGPDSAGNDGGAIQLGEETAFHGLVSYDNATSVLYIDNAYNSNNGDIAFRTKTAGTAVTPLTLKGSGQTIINGTSALATATIYGHDASADTMVIRRPGGGYVNDIFSVESDTGANYFRINGINGNAYFHSNSFWTGANINLEKDQSLIWADANQSITVTSANVMNIKTGSGGAFSFQVAGTEYMRVTGGTAVVNGSTALGTLTVYGHDAADETLVLQAASGTSDTQPVFLIEQNGGTDMMSVLHDGSTGIGTNANSSYQFYVRRDEATSSILGRFENGNGTQSNNLQIEVGNTNGLGAKGIALTTGSGSGKFGIDVSDGGSPQFVIDPATDNVGINSTSPNATLTVDGSMSLPIESISATDTLDDTNHTVLVDASGGSRTVNLPAASGSTGKVFIIKKTDSSSNNVVIDPNASETIDGSSTFTFNAQYRAVTIQCDGSNWHIISSYIVNY